jgi:hypothetical protein
MKLAITLLAATMSAIALAQPASAGPGFAYSWLATEKTFEQCKAAAASMIKGLNYEHVEDTRFGVTGEKTDETLYINCEDLKHVAILLIRPTRPRAGEIEAFVSFLEHRLDVVSR